jgi:NAD(P)-dependent dehydrogenase (short-subunit alcohol dehydrogenase family)
MELGLEGKVALVSGASGGIGAAISAELAREGVDLCLTGRDRTRLEHLASSIAEISSRRPCVHVGDLRNPETSSAAVAATLAAFGRLDIAVNSAGDTKRGDFFKLTEEDWHGGFAVKFHGAASMTHAAWPHLRQTQGVVINIVGIGSRAGSAEFTIGGAVNAALLNFTKAMADIGIRDGVRVNAINPGLIETDRLVRNIERLMREHSCSRDEAVSRLLAPRGTTRFGHPQEIGWLVAFLASQKAAFIHGAIIDIDGGSTRAL